MKFWQGGHFYMLQFAKITQQMFRDFADEGVYVHAHALKHNVVTQKSSIGRISNLKTKIKCMRIRCPEDGALNMAP